MKYLLDANIFMEANRRYYYYKVVPAFWQWLKDDNDLCTIKTIIEEINAGSDNLHELVDGIQITDQEQVTDPEDTPLERVLSYVLDRYNKKRIELNDNQMNDLTLISVALKQGLIVVTGEKKEDENKKKPEIKIPDVCDGLKIPCENDIVEILKRKHIDLSNYKSPKR